MQGPASSAWPFCMSISDLETLNSTYSSAIDAGDWDAALTALAKIEVRLLTTPNLSRSLGGGGNQSISWNAQNIAAARQWLQQQKAAGYSTSGPYQQTPVTYQRADATDTY